MTYRLPEKQWEEFVDTVICIGDDSSREVVFKEDIPQLLDTQIADLLSRVNTPEKLKETITQIIHSAIYGEESLGEFQEGEIDLSTYEKANEILNLFRLSTLPLLEQARKGERDEIIKLMILWNKCPENLTIKTCKRNTFCSSCWEQALQKE